MARRIATALAVTLLLAAPLFAQKPGVLRGIVVTDTGTPVAGATVRAGDNGPAVLTDASGLFKLLVPPKTYDVVVTRTGFATERIPGVKVEAGKDKDVSAILTKK
jgi:uncharacterized membrane protein